MTIANFLTLIRGLPSDTEVFFTEPGKLYKYLGFKSLDIEQNLTEDGKRDQCVIVRFEEED